VLGAGNEARAERDVGARVERVQQALHVGRIVRQVGIEGGNAGVSVAARMQPAKLVRRTDAELARPHHHADAAIGGSAGRESIERAVR
jgi:hypothetical protein